LRVCGRMVHPRFRITIRPSRRAAAVTAAALPLPWQVKQPIRPMAQHSACKRFHQVARVELRSQPPAHLRRADTTHDPGRSTCRFRILTSTSCMQRWWRLARRSDCLFNQAARAARSPAYGLNYALQRRAPPLVNSSTSQTPTNPNLFAACGLGCISKCTLYRAPRLQQLSSASSQPPSPTVRHCLRSRPPGSLGSSQTIGWM
jgi:hypothetical protein